MSLDSKVVPLVGAPKQGMVVASLPDGTKQVFPVVMTGLLSDQALGQIAVAVRGAVAAELDARGLTRIDKAT